MTNPAKLLSVAAAVVLSLACGLAGAPALPAGIQSTAAPGGLQAPTSTLPIPTQAVQATAIAGIPVNYKNVSFILPAGLASDAAPQTVPQPAGSDLAPWDAAPEHIEFRLDNYSLGAAAFPVRELRFYPAREYADMQAGANITLQRLQGLLADTCSPVTRDNAPRIPYFNADAMFAAQARRLHFQSGDGVRMLTQYGQAAMPAANDSAFYQFTGLTGDGRYLVVAILPIQTSLLPASADPSNAPPVGAGKQPRYWRRHPGGNQR